MRDFSMDPATDFVKNIYVVYHFSYIAKPHADHLSEP